MAQVLADFPCSLGPPLPLDLVLDPLLGQNGLDFVLLRVLVIFYFGLHHFVFIFVLLFIRFLQLPLLLPLPLPLGERVALAGFPLGHDVVFRTLCSFLWMHVGDQKTFLQYDTDQPISYWKTVRDIPQ